MSVWEFATSSLVLPFLVFGAELCVVTISTVRIIVLGRGMKYLAATLGLVEITIWLFAIGQIMKNVNDLRCFAGFAAGFTIGNYLGVLLEKKLALGTQVICTITSKDARELIRGFKNAGFGVTCVDGQGATGPVKMVFTVIKRRELTGALGIISKFDAGAFYSIEDVQSATSGVFPRARGIVPSPLQFFRQAA